MSLGKLTLFAGKMGAGKSTMSQDLSAMNNAVLISEDEWLESIYPNQISSLDDYMRLSKVLKPQIKKLVQNILQAGTSIVMDYPANTISQREWLKSIFSEIDAPHELIYLDIPNEICLKQIENRRLENPERHKTDTKEMFEVVTKFFQEPSPHEGFSLTIITSNT